VILLTVAVLCLVCLALIFSALWSHAVTSIRAVASYCETKWCLHYHIIVICRCCPILLSTGYEVSFCIKPLKHSAIRWLHCTNDAWWQVWHANIYIYICVCPEVEMSHFNWETYIFACHRSPSCIVCFVPSLMKIWLNSKYIYTIKNLHFTGMEPYDNYITTSAGSKYARIGVCEATPTVAPQPMSVCDLERRICLHWRNPMSHHDIGLCQCKQSRPVEYLTAHDWIWTNSNATF